MFIDSHCHLDFPDLRNRLPEVLLAMRAAQVDAALCIGVSKAGAQGVLELAAAHKELFASVGVHPDEESAAEFTVDELLALATHPKVVGIGETGLDYHWVKGPTAWQKKRFENHIQAALSAQLPLIVHTRDAGHDALDIMRAHQVTQGVIHCFTEDTDFARAALNLGLYLSFSGIVTFKNARDIQAACQFTPQERVLIETDAPFLAPVPLRGKPNEPAYVRHTAQFIAQLRGDSLEDLARATTQNFYRLFSKAAPPERLA